MRRRDATRSFFTGFGQIFDFAGVRLRQKARPTAEETLTSAWTFAVSSFNETAKAFPDRKRVRIGRTIEPISRIAFIARPQREIGLSVRAYERLGESAFRDRVELSNLEDREEKERTAAKQQGFVDRVHDMDPIFESVISALDSVGEGVPYRDVELEQTRDEVAYWALASAPSRRQISGEAIDAAVNAFAWLKDENLWEPAYETALRDLNRLDIRETSQAVSEPPRVPLRTRNLSASLAHAEQVLRSRADQGVDVEDAFRVLQKATQISGNEVEKVPRAITAAQARLTHHLATARTEEEIAPYRAAAAALERIKGEATANREPEPMSTAEQTPDIERDWMSPL